MPESSAPSPIGVRDPRLYTLVNIADGRKETGTQYDLRVRLGLNGPSVSCLVHGSAKTHRGWRLNGPPTPALSSIRTTEPAKGRPFKGPQAKLRPCIRCRHDFHSAHAGHRLCPACAKAVSEATNAIGVSTLGHAPHPGSRSW